MVIEIYKVGGHGMVHDLPGIGSDGLEGRRCEPLSVPGLRLSGGSVGPNDGHHERLERRRGRRHLREYSRESWRVREIRDSLRLGSTASDAPCCDASPLTLPQILLTI